MNRIWKQPSISLRTPINSFNGAMDSRTCDIRRNIRGKQDEQEAEATSPFSGHLDEPNRVGSAFWAMTLLYKLDNHMHNALAKFIRSLSWQCKLKQKSTTKKHFTTLMDIHLSGTCPGSAKIAWTSFSVWRVQATSLACISGRSPASCSPNRNTSTSFWSNMPMTLTKA